MNSTIPHVPRFAVAAALAAALGSPAAAQNVELPVPVGYVNDFADVIPANVEASITNVVDEVRAKSGGEIVVVTLPTLPGGRSRDQIALEIGRQWNIGRAGEAGDERRNTGAVVLVVPKETSEDGSGHVKIELADRASTFITATEAGRIRDRLMIPAFREGDYGQGILLGVVALAEMYAAEFDFALTGDYPRPEPAQRRDRDGPSIFAIIAVVAFFLFISRLFRGGGGGGGRGLRGGRRRRYGGPVILPIPFPLGGRRGGFGGFGGGFGGFGGGGGGGFGGFGGGGGFSGGGAGGSW